MNSLHLNPIDAISGEVRLPGSKSMSNRALLLAALTHGATRVENVLASDDIRFMLTALAALGIETHHDGADVVVHGRGGPLLPHGSNAHHDLYLGLAGTALRPLTAALCLGGGSALLSGEPRMQERPIAHLVDALRHLGATIEYTGEPGFPPVRVTGTGLGGGTVPIDGSVSSQFLTSLLLAAPLAARPVTVEVTGELVSKPYIDITCHLMQAFGVTVANDGYRRFAVPRRDYVSPGSVLVEGDASAASYFLAAGAVRGDGVTVHGVGTDSMQGDVAFADVLEHMGAHVTRHPASIEVRPGTLTGVDVDLNHIPDAAMTLATLALFADGPTRIRNIHNWRVKETDRLAAMATELRKVGAGVEEGEDWLGIEPPETIRHAAIDTYGDHRMAMCFSLAALGPEGVTINDPGCVAKTFPDYFDVFGSLSERPAIA